MTSTNRSRTPTRRATEVVVFVTTLVATLLAATHPVNAAPVAAPPDLQSQIPGTEMYIARTPTNTREFRYTHLVANLGPGPLEIRPEYDSTTDNARGYQRLYQRDGSTLSLASEAAMGGQFFYHAIHGHYHYPLASFGLFSVKTDGSVGTPVALSPKVGFCIADSTPVTSGAGPSTYPGTNCNDPRSTLGISVGWADVYDNRDDGQSVPIDGLADGTYWFRSIVDPDNFLIESDEANNVTDVKVRIAGDTVQVLETRQPVTPPPTVVLGSPGHGATLSGAVNLSATANDPSGITGVEFLVDGVPVGQRQAASPYGMTWDSTTVGNGTHVVTARAYTGAGLRGTAPAALVYVANQAGGASLSVDRSVSVDGTATVSTPPFDTSAAGETLLALVSSDGPAGGPQTSTVSGGGLSWRLVRRSNSQPGTSEVWTATATAPLAATRITATPGVGGYDQSLTVVAIRNAIGVGTSAGGSAGSGAPRVSVTTSRDGAWIFGAGNDWDNALARVVPSDQALTHQWVDTRPGDTFWSQSTLAPTPAAGTVVSFGAVSPTTDRWNLSAVEVLPAGPTVPGPVISDVLAGGRTSSSAVITWTTDVTSSSQVHYGTTLSYGQSTPLDQTLTTSHQVVLSGLTPDTQYHYRVTSTDGSGASRTSVDHVFSTAVVSTITCDLTSPTTGSTVTGTVTVTAAASSTASVSKVQFTLDGAALGPADTQAPYQVAWDTTTTADGPHTLAAVATDPTGNWRASAGVVVTVANTGPPPPSGPVAAYSFNQGTGTSVPDASGTGNVGSRAGAAWSTTGRYGGAMSFNGSNARVDVPDAPSLRLSSGLTVEAWLRPTTTNAAWRSAVLKESPGGLAYALYSQTTANRAAGYVNLGGSDIEARASVALAANTWTHVAVTYDGTSLRVFRNGTLVGSVTAPGSIISSTGALRIGGNTVWGEYFSGLIDEVRIYNRALSATDITTDMNTPLSG